MNWGQFASMKDRCLPALARSRVDWPHHRRIIVFVPTIGAQSVGNLPLLLLHQASLTERKGMLRTKHPSASRLPDIEL